MSAVQHALQTPEILAAILQQVRLNSHDYDKDKSLLHCGLCNRAWFEEAMRILWASPTNGFIIDDALGLVKNPLPTLFSRIDPQRRQFYADFIEKANLMTNEKEARYDTFLDGISFPKLHTVTVFLDDGHHVVHIDGPKVKVMTLNPRFEEDPDTYGVSRDDLDEILDQIVDIFPNLEEVDFADCVQAYVGSLQRFAGRLPRLRTFDHSMVTETNEEDPDF